MASSRRRKFRLRAIHIAVIVLAVVTLAVSAFAMQAHKPADTSAFTPAAPTIAPRTIEPNVAFIGDSYAVGSGTSNKALRWSTLVSNEMGWTENNFAKGGTGYMVSSDARGCGLAYCPKYWEAVPELKKVSPAPSAVIVSGGRNDYKAGMEKVAPNVRKTFQDIRRGYPTTVIISLPPFYGFQPLPDGLAEMGEVVKRETLAVGGVYLDIGQPLLNKPKLVGPDEAHPTDEGYALLASATVDMLRKQKIAEKMPKPPTAAPTATAAVTAPAVKDILTADFTSQNGAPTSATGQTFGIWDNGNNTSGMTVADGLLVHGEATATNSASYLEAGIGKPVEKIGAEAVFTDTAGGQIALVAWQDSIAAARNKANPDPIPNGGIHFVAGPTGWHLGIYEKSKGERIVADGNLNLVADGKTKHRFEVVRKGNQAWIVLPDGTTTPPGHRPAAWGLDRRVGDLGAVRVLRRLSACRDLVHLGWLVHRNELNRHWT